MAISDDFTPISVPFASASGSTDTIPETSVDGSVNWTDGFGPDYAKNIGENGKLVTRKQMNGLLNKICLAIRYIQTGGVALFNTAFATQGRTYKTGALVWAKIDGVWRIYEAKNDTTSNPSTSSASWTPYTLMQYVNSRAYAKDLGAESIKVGNNILLKKSGTSDKATGCPNPTEASDFANKRYVDSEIKKKCISSSSPITSVQVGNGSTYTVPQAHDGKLMIATVDPMPGTPAQFTIDIFLNGSWLNVCSSLTYSTTGIVRPCFTCYCAAGLKVRITWTSGGNGRIHFVG